MSASLEQKLRQARVERHMARAHAIRDHPPGDDRNRQGEIFLRQAMYERTVSRITAEKESRIFRLRFRTNGRPCIRHLLKC